MRTPFALIIQITPERLPLPDSFQMVVGMAVSGPAQDPACEVVGLYRTRADRTISRVAGIEPGARSIQPYDFSGPISSK